MVEASLFFLFDAAIVNSYIMYCQKHQGRRLTHEQYRIELAKDLLSDANSPVQPIESPQAPHGPHCQILNPETRLTERHFPGQLEKSCTVCSKRKGRGRKTTTFCCKQCNPPMCVVPCFELYHTKADPQRYL